MKKSISFFVLTVMLIVCFGLTACNDMVEVSDGTLPYNYDLSPYVSLGDYIGIEYVPADTAVTSEQIDDAIADVLDENSTTADVTDRGAENGDILNIDYVGKMNDIAFEGGTAAGQKIVLGSSGYITGFDEGLVGVKAGDTVDLNLTFPDPYLNNPSYAGKDCVFTVTVNKVQKVIVPELNDEFVKKVSESSNTVAEYRQEMADILLRENEYKAYVEKCNSVWNSIIKNSKIISLPENEVNAYVTSAMDMYKEIATNNNMTLEEYFTAINTDYDTAYNYIKSSAEQSVSEELVIFSISHKEGMSISDQEYDEGAKGYADGMGYANIEALEKEYGREVILKSLMWDKVVEFCAEKAVAVEENNDTSTETASGNSTDTSDTESSNG